MSEKEDERDNKSAFLGFLSQLASFTGDLSQLTAPAFLLSGISILEYCVSWCDYPQHLHNCLLADSAEERMLLVTKWFLSTLFGSYHERCQDGSEKKPYNPILGELFKCHWSFPVAGSSVNIDADMLAEQVSHHPPVSAYHLAMPGLHLDGFCGQKTKFKGTFITVSQTGHAILTLTTKDKQEEKYSITLPHLIIRGILSGNIFLDLSGTVDIHCTATGMHSTVEFVPKPWFSGDYHHIKGSIFKSSSLKTSGSHISLKPLASSSSSVSELFSISGRWVDTMYYKDTRSGSTNSEKFLLLHVGRTDCPVKTAPNTLMSKQYPRAPKLLKPVEELEENESRRVWKSVSEALSRAEYGKASEEKNFIEERQRALRKERKDEDWKPTYFEWKGDALDKLKSKKNFKNDDDDDDEDDLGGSWIFK